MSEIYKKSFSEHREHFEEYLCLRMKELVILRDEAVKDSALRSYEEKYILNGMKSRTTEEEEYIPIEYTYLENLETIENIYRVMKYKATLFYRYENSVRFSDKRYKKEKEEILSAVKYNPYGSYESIVETDPSLDIETELEHMIEIGELKSIQLKKKTRYGYRKWLVTTEV